MRYLFGFFAAFMLMGNSPGPVDQLLETGKDAEAFAAAQQGAERGDAELTGYLGWFYDNGRHVAEDKAKAADLYRRAADAGDDYAQWRLGVMIDEGDAPGTLQEAVELFRKAAAQKYSDGMVGLAVMSATGRGVERDYVASMRYYQAAARMGNSHGLEGIGVLYANGQGVEKSMDEAVAYWLVAASAGNAMASDLLQQHLDEIEDGATSAVLTRADTIAATYGVDASFDVAREDDRQGL